MLQKIKNWFVKKIKEYPSHIKFKDGIKALAMEEYKDVTVFYLSKPSLIEAGKEQPIYHAFYKREFYFGEADTLEELEEMAHEDIDNKFKNK